MESTKQNPARCSAPAAGAEIFCNFHRNINLLMWNCGKKHQEKGAAAQKSCQSMKELIKAGKSALACSLQCRSLYLTLHIPLNLPAASAASILIFLLIVSIPANCRASCSQQRMNRQVPRQPAWCQQQLLDQQQIPASSPGGFHWTNVIPCSPGSCQISCLILGQA